MGYHTQRPEKSLTRGIWEGKFPRQIKFFPWNCHTRPSIRKILLKKNVEYGPYHLGGVLCAREMKKLKTTSSSIVFMLEIFGLDVIAPQFDSLGASFQKVQSPLVDSYFCALGGLMCKERNQRILSEREQMCSLILSYIRLFLGVKVQIFLLHAHMLLLLIVGLEKLFVILIDINLYSPRTQTHR